MTTCGNCAQEFQLGLTFNKCGGCHAFICPSCTPLPPDERKCCERAGAFPIRGKRVRIVILSKGQHLGLFAFSDAGKEQRTMVADTRRDEIAIRVYDDRRVARAHMRRGLSVSVGRGWTIGYDGIPLSG